MKEFTPVKYPTIYRLFRNDLEVDLGRNLFVKFNCRLVRAKLLNIVVDIDNLSVDIESLLSQSLSDLDVINRTEDSASSAGLRTHLQ